jgi:hypothetical protein
MERIKIQAYSHLNRLKKKQKGIRAEELLSNSLSEAL